MAAKAAVEKLISTYPVAVFSKSYCPYCSRAKSTLASQFSNAQIGILELDQMDEGDDIQHALALRAKSSRVTVPQIYIQGKLVGGNDNLQALVSKSNEWTKVKKSVNTQSAAPTSTDASPASFNSTTGSVST